MLLRDYQEQFALFLLDSSHQAIFSASQATHLTVKEQFQIYYNNRRDHLLEALQAIYPVVEKLVGQSCFTQLVYQFIQRHIALEASFINYGKEFADFLVNYSFVNVPYLSQIAQLEWAWHEVFHEAASDVFDFHQLSLVDAQNYPNIIFKCHPATRLLAFSYPILEIWQFCLRGKEDSDTKLAIEQSPCYLLIARPDLEVSVHALTLAEYELLTAFKAHNSLEAAMDKACMHASLPDVEGYLQQHIVKRNITGFEIAS